MSKRFEVQFAPRAGRDLKKLKKQNPQAFARIWVVIEQMVIDPMASDVDRIEDAKDVTFRRRVGDHRII